MAQKREEKTTQPKEELSTNSKSSIKIINYLGGYYFLTVDEIKIKNNTLSLIEAKHSKSSFPSKNDIKYGLVKMILFSNISTVSIEGKNYRYKAVLKLTGKTLNSNIYKKLEDEARINNFYIECDLL